VPPRCFGLSSLSSYDFAQTATNAQDKKDAYTCKAYPLREVFDSEEVCDWIAETIPDVIQPGSWKAQDSDQRGTVIYNPKAGVMVIYHTPDVHEQIGELLTSMRTMVRPADGTMSNVPAKQGNVVPAQFSTAAPATTTAKNDLTGPAAYPIAPPLQQPKHLFHFIIRYEGASFPTLSDLTKLVSGGEQTPAVKDDSSRTPLNNLLHFIIRYEGDGIIDENVVEFIKGLQKLQSPNSDNGPPNPPPGPASGVCPYPPAVGAAVGAPCGLTFDGPMGFSGATCTICSPASMPSPVLYNPTSPGTVRMPLADELRMPLADDLDDLEMPFADDDDAEMPAID